MLDSKRRRRERWGCQPEVVPPSIQHLQLFYQSAPHPWSGSGLSQALTGSTDPSRGRQSRWGPAVSETSGAAPRKIGFNRVLTAAPSRDPATPRPWHRASLLTLPAPSLQKLGTAGALFQPRGNSKCQVPGGWGGVKPMGWSHPALGSVLGRGLRVPSPALAPEGK